MFPVVLCGCRTWSPTLREEDWLWVLEIRVLEKIYGAKGTRLQVSGGRLHNEELCAQHCSLNIVRFVKLR